MNYLYRFAIFVPAANLADAATLANQVFGDPSDAAIQNFSLHMSDGTYAGSGVMAQRELDEAMSILKSGTVPWVVMFLWDASSNALIDATQHWADGIYGSPWGWQQCLDRLGITEVAS